MSGIGLAYKTPEQQAASTLDAGARAVTQAPAAPGIGMATIPVDPRDNDGGQPVPQDPAPVAAPAPAASMIDMAKADAASAAAPQKPLIDFHTNPLGAIGLVMSSVAAGINGTESPVEQLKKNQLEQQAQQYRTASLALDVVEKTSKYITKTPSAQRAGVIADLDKRFSPALGGQSIAPFLTAITAGSDAETAARTQALRGMNLSPQMMAYFSSDPEAAVKFIDAYNTHQASKETPEEAAAKAGAVADAQNKSGASKPMTPAEIAANKIAQQNANNSGATLAETKRHNTVDEASAANKPLTQDQATAATYADRAHEANAVIDKHGATQGTSVKGRALDEVPGGNFMQSGDFQKNSQAERNFVNAILRKESGSAINPSEFDSAAKQYFPQPGDTADVIAQKAVNRSTVINGLRREAGPSYKPPAPVIRYDAKGNRISD